MVRSAHISTSLIRRKWWAWDSCSRCFWEGFCLLFDDDKVDRNCLRLLAKSFANCWKELRHRLWFGGVRISRYRERIVRRIADNSAIPSHGASPILKENIHPALCVRDYHGWEYLRPVKIISIILIQLNGVRMVAWASGKIWNMFWLESYADRSHEGLFSCYRRWLHVRRMIFFCIGLFVDRGVRIVWAWWGERASWAGEGGVRVGVCFWRI